MKWAAALAVLAAAAPAPVRADAGTIVFARWNAVYQQPADGGLAVKIAELPDDATEVRFVEATRDGRLLVLDMGSFPIWIAAPGPERPARVQGGAICGGRARPAPAGEAVVCPSVDGTLLVAATRDEHQVVPGVLDEPQFRGPAGFDLAGLSDEGVVGLDRRAPETRRLLARPGARSHLIVSPDGDRAVAVFGEGDAGRIRSFVLDGKGVARQLGGPGVPVLWSWDSTWVLFQEGDIKDAPAPALPGDEGRLDDAPGPAAPFLLAAPAKPKRTNPRRPVGRRPPPVPAPPTTRACVARATGGEVKCWDSFTGLSFSPDSTLVLLKRDKALYVGKIAGVRPDPPLKLIDDVDGAATWTPGPVAAPLVPPPPAPPPADFSL